MRKSPATVPAAQRLFAPDGVRDPEPLAVLSHGKGQQSTALGYMLHYEADVRERYAPGRLLTLTSQTGNEHPETEDHARYLKDFYAAAGEHFEEITPEMGLHTPAWTSLEHHYASRNNIGSKSFRRSCTDNLKIKPFYKRLEQILVRDYGVAPANKKGLYEYVELLGEKITVMIGFDANEIDRRADPEEVVPPWMSACIERVYPLADLGMTREDCNDYIRSKGHPAVFPSLCVFCPFKTHFDVHYAATFLCDIFGWPFSGRGRPLAARRVRGRRANPPSGGPALARPVLDLEARDARELADVVGHERDAQADGVSGDQGVQRPDWGARLLEHRPDAPVRGGGLVPEGEHLQRQQEPRERLPVLLRRGALLRAVVKLGGRHRGHPDLAHLVLLEPA